jgi:GR25 family glycosyltransferase involved in LPS biosynthesis
MNIPLDIDCYMIVIKGNEASEYYASYCIDSWKNVGFDVKIFDAIVPADLPSLKELTFTEYSHQKKYTDLGLKVPITDTEKACYYSHFCLWKKASRINRPLMVLEHDSYLDKPWNLWYDKMSAMIFYDEASMGSYIINPSFARGMVDKLKRMKISSGPYSMLEKYAVDSGIESRFVNKKNPLFVAASNQVMSDKYKNTIEHYCNENTSLFRKEAFHRFIKI